ncbi:MAG: hypothetical protein IPM25_14545 [Chloracidobacterium sp.]|nr:hypothetical protein [Chloracidobacterium sp.]
MTLKMKIYLAAAAALVLISVGSLLWSEYRLGRLEADIRRARADGEEHAAAARKFEAEAAGLRHKIEFQEERLSEMKRMAAQQDEEIEKLKLAADDARGSVRRARSIERIDVTAAELCRKLAELGHPCE